MNTVPPIRQPRLPSQAIAARALLAAGVALLCCAAGAREPAWAGGLSVRAEPRLQPSFDRATSDYATRCAERRSLRLRFVARHGYRVTVRDRAGSGKFSRRLEIAPGRAVSFRAGRHGRSRTYHVRCLPADFPPFKSERHGRPQAAFYVLTPNAPVFGHRTYGRFAAIFDNRGAPVWWRAGEPGRDVDDASLLPDGNVAWSNSLVGLYGGSPTNRFEEHRLDGSLVREYRTAGSPTDFHELEPVGRTSHRMLLTYRRREHEDMTSCGGDGAPSDEPVYDGEIQEVDAIGNVTWSWNTHADGHISIDETGRYCAWAWSYARALKDAADIIHANAVETFTTHGRAKVLLSAARLDAIYQIDKQTKAIDWKLGGTATDKSLRVLGDDEYAPWHFAGQHDVRRLSDGTISLYDNGTADARPPRAVRFRIDEKHRTATRVESLGDPRAPLSFCCGGARKLSGGNWAVSWGFVPFVSELTPAGRRVFQLEFDGVYSYRVDPVPPGRLSRRALRRGMDRMRP